MTYSTAYFTVKNYFKVCFIIRYPFNIQMPGKPKRALLSDTQKNLYSIYSLNLSENNIIVNNSQFAIYS